MPARFSAILASLMLSAVTASPVISEFVASNATGLTDEDGDYPDWIEVHNPTTSPLDLTGWHLTDDETLPTQWPFPPITLPPGEHLIVFASGKNRTAPNLHTNFRLAKGGEYLALIDPTLTPVSLWTYPPQATDISYGLTSTANTITLLPENALVRALVPDANDDALIGTDWQGGVAGFDDSSWRSGAAGVGYERFSGFENEIGLDLEEEAWSVNSSIYVRAPFASGINPANLASLTLRMKYDDGFAAFLNGDPVASANTPSPLVWNSNATAAVNNSEALQFQDFDLTESLSSLKASGNILAIHGLNQFSISGDLLIRPELVATLINPPEPVAGYFSLPTPGQDNAPINTDVPVSPNAGPLTISEPSGIKTSAITITLTPEIPEAEIRYTLDGSEPTSTDLLFSPPLTLSSPARLRARTFLPGRLPGPVAVADYSFLDPSLQSYLSEVPVIVMDNFGAGSYPNKGRSNDGRDIVQLPRQANVISIFVPSEDNQPFLNPPVLQSRSGCRVRGSSSSTFPRKPLSVEFWDESDSDLDLSPFGFAAEADWVLNPPNPTFDRSLIHNPVSFGFARMIGAHAPDSKVVAVFQNTDGGSITAGDLAGVYIFTEKIERNRMGVDFSKLSDDATEGGWMLNIDRMQAIPEDQPITTVQPNFHAAGPDGILQIPDDEQNSGGTQSVDDISEFYHSYLNFESPGGYQILPNQRTAIQSVTRAMDSAVWAGDFNQHLDSPSWARAFAVHNFSKNQDAHVLSTYIYQETPNSKIKVGPVWDFDRAYTRQGNASANPFWASDRDWYAGLFQSSDFRQTLQDLWQKARHTTATDNALRTLVNDAAAGLQPDQIAASGLAFTTWQDRVTEMRTWVVDRAAFLDSQYEPLPDLSPESGRYDTLPVITMTPENGGTVYYTLDGSDPRASGGNPSPSALAYSSPLAPGSLAIVTARTLNNGRWSAPVSRYYYRESDIPRLAISEISYHPAAPSPAEIVLGFTNDDDFEFLELTNVGPSPVDLTRLALTGGITFDFSSGTLTSLSPGERVLIVRNTEAFTTRYGSGLPVTGQYAGALNNAGDLLVLEDRGLHLVLQDFSYSDDPPWPVCADGSGYSLVLKNPQSQPDHSIFSNWRCSAFVNGNPGTTDARPPFVGSPLADLDQDGFSALLEHVLGTSDHTSGDTTDLIGIGTATAADLLTYPTLEMTFAIGADLFTPLPEWSPDLEQWTSGPEDLVLLSASPNGDGTATLVWRSTRPTSDPRQFFRVRVNQN